MKNTVSNHKTWVLKYCYIAKLSCHERGMSDSYINHSRKLTCRDDLYMNAHAAIAALQFCIHKHYYHIKTKFPIQGE